MSRCARLVRVVVIGWLLAATLLVAHANGSGAEDLVRETISSVLAVLRPDESTGARDQTEINALVERSVLPHFDFTRMTRLAAGRSWRNLSEPQRMSLVAEFRTLLVRTYSVALERYQDQVVDYLPAPPQRHPNVALVKTRIKQPGAKAIAMDYRLAASNSEWKVYDILVDGISLVVNYRSLFNDTIETSGAEGLIELLRDKNDGSG